MTQKPFPQSFWIDDPILCAGHYPGDLLPEVMEQKLAGLVNCSIKRVISLMEADETDSSGMPFKPYRDKLIAMSGALGREVEFIRYPIKDRTNPAPELIEKIFETLDESLHAKIPTYLHCWGGHGRTGTVVACYLIKRGNSAEEAINLLVQMRATLPNNRFPFEGEQEKFVRAWQR
jgi:protein tyrosine phosphatase